MTFASLFTGIGGFDLGLEQAGLSCVLQCEIDAQCREVLQRHWPEVARHDDITTLRGSDIAGAGLVCGGDPCQQNSTASGPWGSEVPSLGAEFVRVVGEAEPVWVVRENPTRVRRTAPWPPERFAACLEALGYECVLLDLQCSAFTGVSRSRTFVVGSDPARASSFQSLLSDEQELGGDKRTDGAPRPILNAVTAKPWRFDSRDNYIVEPTGYVRVLDTTERLRAQGFPDTWLPEGVSFTRSVNMTGNAVPVQAVRWIGLRIMAAEGAKT